MAETLDPSLRATPPTPPPPPPAPSTSKQPSPNLDNVLMEQLARAALPAAKSPSRAPSVPTGRVTHPPTPPSSQDQRRIIPLSKMSAPRPRALRTLAPAPPPTPPQEHPEARGPLTIFDLPAELRIEIYKLVLEGVIIHILPLKAINRHCPHALIRTSRQVRLEVLPLIHSTCSIRANVTDFDFSGLLTWINRIPPTQQRSLEKNKDMEIRLHTTHSKPTDSGAQMRRWLHLRADLCRPQPGWKYKGTPANRQVAADLRRRLKRMTEEGKARELRVMLEAIGVKIA